MTGPFQTLVSRLEGLIFFGPWVLPCLRANMPNGPAQHNLDHFEPAAGPMACFARTTRHV
jgi:hypothetical protein